MSKHMRAFVLGIAALALIWATAGASPAAEEGEGNPVVIGAPIPLKSRYGLNGQRGMVLAVEEINGAGGVMVGNVKRPLKLEIVDTDDLEPGMEINEVMRRIEDLVLRKKVDLLAGGPCLSESGLEALDLISRLNKIHLVSIGCYTPAWDQKVSQDREKYKHSFRVSGSVKWYVEEALDLMRKIKEKHGFDKLFVSADDSEMCRKASEIVERLATKDGWKVVGRDIHAIGTTDFTAPLTECKNSGAQVLFIWGYSPETRTMLRQWSAMEVPALPLGFIGAAEDSGFWKATKGGCAFSIATLSETGNVPSKATPRSMEFFTDFEKRWMQPPRSTGCVAGYESIYVIKDAIERAGTLDTEALIKAIEKTNLKGVRGTIRFDENHQVVYGYDPNAGVLGCWVQWQEGQRIQVFPEAAAMAEIKLPPWMKK
ncbi:MAG: ABC transporter substrate-binding protein [Thermodesulfobacteriota bacterium]